MENWKWIKSFVYVKTRAEKEKFYEHYPVALDECYPTGVTGHNPHARMQDLDAQFDENDPIHHVTDGPCDVPPEQRGHPLIGCLLIILIVAIIVTAGIFYLLYSFQI